MEVQPAEYSYAKLPGNNTDRCIRENGNATVEDLEIDDSNRYIRDVISNNLFTTSQIDRPIREFTFENQENISFVGNKDDNMQSKMANSQNNEKVAHKLFGDIKQTLPHLNESFWNELQSQNTNNTISEIRPLNNKTYNEINRTRIPYVTKDIKDTDNKRVIVESQNNFKIQAFNKMEQNKSISDISPFGDDIFSKDSPSYKNKLDSEITRMKSRQKYLYRKTRSLIQEAQMVQSFLFHDNIRNEVVDLFEHSNELIKIKQLEEYEDIIDVCGSPSPDSYENNQQTMQNFISQIEGTQAAQEAIFFKQRCHNRYFGGGSSQSTLSSIKAANTKFIPKLGKRLMSNIRNFNRQTKSQLRIVEKDFDSDATESSSGGESFDDSSNYKNDINKNMTIIKRAAYEWLRDKCSILAKKEWLECKIHDNEIQLKKLEDAQKRIRASKSTFRFEGEIPTNGNVDVAATGCARTRPLVTKLFRKRKLLQMSNLHTASTIAARPSTVRCGCQWPMQPCSICTGREDPMAPRPPNDKMNLHEKLALLDPGLHTKLSLLTEIHQNFHFEAIMKMNEWQLKMKRHGPRLNKMISKSEKYREQHKKFNYCNTDPKPGLKKRGRKPNAQKNAEIVSKRNVSLVSLNTCDIENYDSSSCSNLNETHKMLQSEVKENHQAYDTHYKKHATYNMDNIFVPQNVIATTRVEVLPYKEIVTPKWRILDISVLRDVPNIPEVIEDLSEGNALKRHDKAFCEERRKFGLSAKFMWTTRSRANKRLYIPDDNIKSSDSDPNSLDDSECSNNYEDDEALQSKEKPILKQISLSPTNVKNYLKYDFWPQTPYIKRCFPLSDEEYNEMIKVMPSGHNLHISQTSSEEKSVVTRDYSADVMETEEIQFRTSYVSDTDYSETDDPNDPEWN